MEKDPFGTFESPNLDILSKFLSVSLAEFENFIGQEILFGNKGSPFKKLIKQLYRTPEKPNTARSEVPVFVDSKEAGLLYCILFCPGDGTGDSKTYTVNDVVIPECLRFDVKQERVIPRKKSCSCEAFFPFFSVYSGNIVPNVVSLEELSLAEDGRTITSTLHLGELSERCVDIAKDSVLRNQKRPFIEFTTGYRTDGTRFGDPHAIYHDRNFPAMQVVGFLSVEKAGTPLAKILGSAARE